jgi:hypothetical protein
LINPRLFKEPYCLVSFKFADERADYDPRKRYGSYFAADRIAAWLSVTLPVKGMKIVKNSGE